MKIKEGDAPNASFEMKEYRISDTCIGQIITDKFGFIPIMHQLYDGERWYCVSEEVFALWLRTYYLGKNAQ